MIPFFTSYNAILPARLCLDFLLAIVFFFVLLFESLDPIADGILELLPTRPVEFVA